MKRIFLMTSFIFGLYVSANTQEPKYTYRTWQNKKNEGYITVYDQNQREVKAIRCSSRPELSIIFNDGSVLFIVSYEELNESEKSRNIDNTYSLHRLYKLDLENGFLDVVDYSSPHARISNDSQYLIFVYTEKGTGISHLRSKKIGHVDYLWDISSVEFNGRVRDDDSFTGFNLIRVIDDACVVRVVNQVNKDIFIRVFFTSKEYVLDNASIK